MNVLQTWLEKECDEHFTIKQLKNLKILNLDDNKLTEIPAELSQLKNLQWLGLDIN